MSSYPDSETDLYIATDSLLELVTSVFTACGVDRGHAALLADSLVTTDLRGCHSHGVLRVPEYVEKLTVKGVDPKALPSVERETGATLVVDGNNAMGQIVCDFAMRKAIEKAEAQGVGIAAVKGSNHCGAMAYFAMMALEHDMIGLAATNALPTMAPWGGAEKIVGINPLAVAIPTANEPAIVLDAAFSGSSHGKIRVYEQKGLPIPQTWAFDGSGNPTTDAKEAMEGLLQPIGGYKGTGLAIIMGILSSVLSGAAYGTESGNMVDGAVAGVDGQFLMAINISAFEEVEHFKTRVDRAIRQIRDSKKADGVDRIYSPGELEFISEQRFRQSGIPLNQLTRIGLQNCAEQFGLDASFLNVS